MAGDTKCGSPLAIFCISTHFVGDTLSGATPVLPEVKLRTSFSGIWQHQLVPEYSYRLLDKVY